MTIFFTIDDISGRGGTERVVANLANAFSLQHSIVIITYHLHFKEISVPLSSNTQIINLEDIYGNFEPKGTIGKLKLCHYINKIIRTNGSKSNALIANCNVFYPFLKRRNTKYIRLEHYNFKFLHRKYVNKQPFMPRIRLFDSLVILSSRELFLWQKLHSNVKVIPNFLPTIPQVSTNHSQKVVLSVGRMSSEKGFLRLLDIWKVVQDSIACHTERSEVSKSRESKINNESMTQERMGESYRFAKSQRIVSDSQVAKMDSSLCCAQNDESMDCFGDKSPRNDGVENDLNEWKLIIVGDGVLKSEIESKIRGLNLGESVLLKPFTKDIESEYLSASIYAMASHFEGFGMVLAEASSYELPCIAFDIATGPSDIIENNKSGFLIADNDLESYANHLIKLMRDESLRIAFGKEAKRIVEKRFSKESIMKLWTDLFIGGL